MLFERIEDRGLAQYSYVIACDRAAEAVVVDPRRDVDVYLDLARARGVRITQVIETHIHADFVSGARELAQATGAAIATSAYDRGETYETQFPHRALADGDTIALGRVRLLARHTPGHTPEHLSYLVFDGARSETTPMILLSGDFLFVGSLGRPDLLGEAETRQLAAKLYASVRRVLDPLPDGLEIAPGHGAGSMCGAGMSGRASSTLGFERIANPYLRAGLSESQFIDAILSHVPPFPDYYRRMKALNARGPRVLGRLPGVRCVSVPVSIAEAAQTQTPETAADGAVVPGAVDPGAAAPNAVAPNAANAVAAAAADSAKGSGAPTGGFGDMTSASTPMSAGATAKGDSVECVTVTRAHELVRGIGAERHCVIDLRDQVSFGRGHIPGAFGIGAGTNVSTWASWVVPYDTPLLLVAARDEDAEAAVRSLVRVGLDDVRGIIAGGIDAWASAGYELAPTPQIAPAALAARLGEAGLHVLDVRADDEWAAGRVPGAEHIMAGDLSARLDELPPQGTLAVICGTGYRSTVAASVLERAGRTNLLNVTGGMAAWRAAGLPIENGASDD